MASAPATADSLTFSMGNYQTCQRVWVTIPSCATVFELLELMAEQLGLLPTQIELTYDQQLSVTTLVSQSLRSTGCYGVRTVVSERLPHLSKTTATTVQHEIYSATEQLDEKTMTERRVLRHSSEANVHAAETVETIALVHNLTDPKAAFIKIEGEELLPYRLLPNGEGVELRSPYEYTWHGPSAADTVTTMDALAQRGRDIAHCKKLLRDLPIALQNSVDAADAATQKSADKIDLTELGAMMMEQRRIKDEIESQNQLLPKLRSTARPAMMDASKFVQRSFQSRLKLAFGCHLIDGNQYIIQPLLSELVASPKTSSVKDLETFEA